jgi:hypothetical protein
MTKCNYLPEGSEGLFKFGTVELLVAVEVHSLEDFFEGSEANSALLLNSQLELEVEFSHFHVETYAVECHILFL